MCVTSRSGRRSGRRRGCEPSCCISSSPRVPTLLFSARLSLFYWSHHMLWLVGPFRGRPLKVRASNTTSSNPPPVLLSLCKSGHQIESNSLPKLSDASPPLLPLSCIHLSFSFMFDLWVLTYFPQSCFLKSCTLPLRFFSLNDWFYWKNQLKSNLVSSNPLISCQILILKIHIKKKESVQMVDIWTFI